MRRKVKFLLLIRSKNTRDSLAGLIASLPGAETVSIYAGMQDILPAEVDLSADVVIIEGSPRQPEVLSALDKIRRLRPQPRTMLLVEPMVWDRIDQPSPADLVIPMNIKAGDMLSSIKKMVG